CRCGADIVVEVGPARGVAIEPVSRQQAQGSRAVATVARKLETTGRVVGRIVERKSVLDEVAMQGLAGEIRRPRDVVRIEPGIQMCDRDGRELVADPLPRRIELAEILLEIPRKAGTDRLPP